MKNKEDMAMNTNDIYNFIEGTLDKSESILIHSARGQSRASTVIACLLYTSPSPRDLSTSRMPFSAWKKFF